MLTVVIRPDVVRTTDCSLAKAVAEKPSSKRFLLNQLGSLLKIVRTLVSGLRTANVLTLQLGLRRGELSQICKEMDEES